MVHDIWQPSAECGFDGTLPVSGVDTSGTSYNQDDIVNSFEKLQIFPPKALHPVLPVIDVSLSPSDTFAEHSSRVGPTARASVHRSWFKWVHHLLQPGGRWCTACIYQCFG